MVYSYGCYWMIEYGFIDKVYFLSFIRFIHYINITLKNNYFQYNKISFLHKLIKKIISF
jgi:hypothetical protein